MELKDYQQQALDTLDRYLGALKEARKQAEEFSDINIDELPSVLREQSAALAHAATNYPLAAWENLRKAAVLPAVTDAQDGNAIPEHINGTQHGTMDMTAPDNTTMSFRMLFEDTWRETVNETIADNY